MEASNEMKVKDEPIYDSQSISDTRKATLSNNKPNNERKFPINNSKRTREDISSDDQTNKRKRQSMKVKEEPIDNEEVEVKAEEDEKFSAREEFANKTSIAFLNEETTTTTNDNNSLTNNQPKTINNDTNNPRNK